MPRLVEGGIGDLLDRESIGRLQFVDQRVAPAAGQEIALARGTAAAGADAAR